MKRVKNFNSVLQSQAEMQMEPILHLYGNTQVDTTTLEQLVQSGQWDKLDSVEGFFAGVYETTNQLYLFCDPLGIYPLFYGTFKDSVYAAPSVPDILTTAGCVSEHSPEGVVSLLLFGHYIADETVFKDIHRCSGGQTVVITKPNNDQQTILWRKKHVYQNKPSATAGELADLFVRQVEKSIHPHEKACLALSGGFDSRAVLGALLECVESTRIETLTFGGGDSYDRRIAKLVAEKVGVKNTLFPITDEVFRDDFLRWHAGEYAYGYSAFATQPPDMLAHIRNAGSKDSSLFWGVGGDAITGSHLHHDDLMLKPCDSFQSFAQLLIAKRAFLPLATVSQITGFSQPEIISIVAGLLRRSVVERPEHAWQSLDAWDIFVRGRMELIAVLPFSESSWLCPHLGREYFNQRSTQCFEEKLNQSAYRRMLSSRFTFLFSLPTRRLHGKSLVGRQLQNLPWMVYWKAGKAKQGINKMIAKQGDGIGRNYGKNRRFIASSEGQDRLRTSIDILLQKGILKRDSRTILKRSQENVQLALMLITLGYAYDR